MSYVGSAEDLRCADEWSDQSALYQWIQGSLWADLQSFVQALCLLCHGTHELNVSTASSIELRHDIIGHAFSRLHCAEMCITPKL